MSAIAELYNATTNNWCELDQTLSIVLSTKNRMGKSENAPIYYTRFTTLALSAHIHITLSTLSRTIMNEDNIFAWTFYSVCLCRSWCCTNKQRERKKQTKLTVKYIQLQCALSHKKRQSTQSDYITPTTTTKTTHNRIEWHSKMKVISKANRQERNTKTCRKITR